MKVVRMCIENFRGIKSACIHFSDHNLLVGTNNVGKSTVCEALDLALGADRSHRFPPVEEFDFYNARYLADDGSQINVRIELILTNLNDEAETLCASHIEFWHTMELTPFNRTDQTARFSISRL